MASPKPEVPDIESLPSCNASLSLGSLVPIPIFPFKTVVTIESLPRVTVFDPEPIAPYPKTFSLETPSAEAFVLVPIKDESSDVSLFVVPSAIKRPAATPIAMF